MKSIPRATWPYAILLIILFSIAAIAAHTTVAFLQDHIVSPDYQQILKIATFAIWALTMGFMFLAGAFGLWAVQFSAEAETFRRIGLFVEDMTYLQDGLVSLDKKGRVTASNPAFKSMASKFSSRARLGEVFPNITEEDTNLLLNAEGPSEVERETARPEGLRTYRFRSQPSAGLNLVLVSDVTARKQEELRRHQMTRLHLIGRIARGVAYDFNALLYNVAGYAALLPRLRPGSAEMIEAVDAITKQVQRGSAMANHLLELSRTSGPSKSTQRIEEHLEKSAELLRLALSAGWQVQLDIRERLPAVPLSGIQIEQAALNLGLLVADAHRTPAIVKISAGKPALDHLFNVGDRFGCVVVVSALDSESSGPVTPEVADSQTLPTPEETGVIQSVVRTVVEEAGGRFDFMKFDQASSLYRIALPSAPIPPPSTAADEPVDFRSYVANWRVLLAAQQCEQLVGWFRETGLNVKQFDSVVPALAALEKEKPDAMVWDKRLLGNDSDGLLRAVLKLCPASGIVVLCEDPESEAGSLPGDLVCLPAHATPSRILRAMIDARGAALSRRR